MSADRCLGPALSHMPPPPNAASRQVLPPALPLQSPGLRPSRLGCRGQGWGLLLALTGPSWGQERREFSQPRHSPTTPGQRSSCLSKLTAARSSLGLQSSTRPFLPSPAAAQALDGWWRGGGGGGAALVRGARGGERERKAGQKEIRMRKRNRWGKMEKGVQEWGPQLQLAWVADVGD